MTELSPTAARNSVAHPSLSPSTLFRSLFSSSALPLPLAAGTLGELLASDVKLDGVLISTPHKTHFALGMEAVRAAHTPQRPVCESLVSPRTHKRARSAVERYDTAERHCFTATERPPFLLMCRCLTGAGAQVAAGVHILIEKPLSVRALPV